jgi:hypothetical protein
VGISIALQYIQPPAIEVTSVRFCYDLVSCQIEFKNNLVLGSHCTCLQVCMEVLDTSVEGRKLRLETTRLNIWNEFDYYIKDP